jgi:hypothetical protein
MRSWLGVLHRSALLASVIGVLAWVMGAVTAATASAHAGGVVGHV